MNTLLDFSRVEAGRIQATYEPTDLASLTRELASLFRSACEQAGLSLVVETPELATPVHVDREMWEKIVLNLLSNAFKFTFAGEIRVSLRSEGEYAVLRVADTGTGIPEAELPRLFERFHRIEGARGRTHEGTGIGLALVQELVGLHKGSIEVASTLGRGSIFTVRIPLGTRHLPPDRIAPPAPRAVSPASAPGARELYSSAKPCAGCPMPPTISMPPTGRFRRRSRTPRGFWWRTITRTCGTISRACCAPGTMLPRFPTERRRSRRSRTPGTISS